MRFTRIHVSSNDSSGSTESVRSIDGCGQLILKPTQTLRDRTIRRTIRKMVKAVLSLQDRKNGQEQSGEKAILPSSLEPRERYFQNSAGNVFIEIRSPDGHTFIVKTNAKNAQKFMNRVNNGQLSLENGISLAAGTCLFSAHDAYALGENGKEMGICDPREDFGIDEPVHSLDVNTDLSIYESELLSRQTELIRLLQKHQRLNHTFTHIPHVEYYLYILDAHNKDFFSSELSQEWFDTVDARTKMVQSHWQESFGDKIDTKTPLHPLRDMIRERVSAGKPISVEELSEALLATQTAYTSVLRRAFASKPPRTFKDINRTGYCAEYMHLASRGPTIALAPPQQEKIMTNTAKIAPDLSQNIVPLYLHSQVVTDEPIGLYGLQRISNDSKNMVVAAVADQYKPHTDQDIDMENTTLQFLDEFKDGAWSWY